MTGVHLHLCMWTAHQLHSWVTDGALSLARIGRAPHIPRHAGNAFCDVQLMLTSRRITHQIALGACLLLHTLSMLSLSNKTHRGGGWGWDNCCLIIEQALVPSCVPQSKPAHDATRLTHVHRRMSAHRANTLAHLAALQTGLLAAPSPFTLLIMPFYSWTCY